MKLSSYDSPAPPCRRETAKARGSDTCGDACDVELVHADAVAVAREALPTEEHRQRLVARFAIFANETRLNLLVALAACADGPRPELCVCDLVAITGASQSMTSHQLGILREAGLVTSRRAGRLVFHRLIDAPTRSLLADALRAIPESVS
jgi:DNA-binding transcriptional ArsR family regulator